MSASGRITITGIQEVISALNGFKTKLPQASKRAIETSLKEGQNTMTSSVHVVSGKLKNSIQYKMEGNEKGTVGATEEYGNAEENRGGPHRFVQPAHDKLQKSFPETYLKELRTVLG